LGIKKHVDAVKKTDHLLLDLSQCNVVDHTVMDNIIHLRNDFENGGGALEVVGLELLKPTSKSNHDLSTRMRDRENRLDHLGQLK